MNNDKYTNIKIFQCNVDTPYAFRSYRKCVNPNDYTLRGEFEVCFAKKVDSEEDFLDHIYQLFNNGVPFDQSYFKSWIRLKSNRLRSLCVSDIIVIDNKKSFYCNEIGWVKIDPNTYEEI